MELSFVFILSPGWMGLFLGIIAVWLIAAVYKYLHSLIFGG